MNNIPPLGWVAIGIVIIVFIGVNVSLIGLLRDAPRLRSKSAARSSQKLQKAVGMLRNPYKETDQQLKELDDLVTSLKNPPEEEQK